MTANLTHFALNADDVEASRSFYETVFGWTFSAFGPPGFYKIQTGSDDEPGLMGALQERRQLVDGVATTGAECTFGVDDVDAVRASVIEAGGTIVMERFTIAGVGHLIAFKDPGGNPILAMQYDDAAE